jgi:hypothetical protein
MVEGIAYVCESMGSNLSVSTLLCLKLLIIGESGSY